MAVEKGIIDSIIDKYPDKKGILIQILQDVQDYLGYLSQENLEYISNKLNISLSKLYGVVTFYTQFKLKKEGKYTIEICDGTACHVSGSKEIFKILKDELKIENDETTEDNIFSIKTVRCIGACSFAPVMRINEKIYSRLNKEKIKKILDDYRKK